jgi:hypothetical protein
MRTDALIFFPLAMEWTNNPWNCFGLSDRLLIYESYLMISSLYLFPAGKKQIVFAIA